MWPDLGAPFGKVQVLGKELRRHPVRALAELRARSAAAAVAWRRGAGQVLTLEAPLIGQSKAGCELVAALLSELGVAPEAVVERSWTTSTREEALAARRLCEDSPGERLLVITSAYHVARARRMFAEAFPPGRVAVHAPEALLRGATAQERAWILAGAPSAQTWADERVPELVLGGLAAALRPLPSAVRWDLEVRAGRWLRASGGSPAPVGSDRRR